MATTILLLFGVFLITNYPILLVFFHVSLELFNSVFHALDVQLELVLDSDVLSNICLQLLDYFFVNSGARWRIVN